MFGHMECSEIRSLHVASRTNELSLHGAPSVHYLFIRFSGYNRTTKQEYKACSCFTLSVSVTQLVSLYSSVLLLDI